MEFVDTHVHLHFPDFDQDRADVIQAARNAGINTFINVGTDLETSRLCLELSEKHDFIYATAGIHPHDAKVSTGAILKDLKELLKHPRMVAIGEVGLDFYRDHSPHDVQKDVLRSFIEMQKEIKKPLVLHCRDAYDAMIEILRSSGLDGASSPGIIHCFSSNKDIMKQLLDLGFYISFAGPLTYKKNDSLREACQACPGDRLLLETDAPFLPPQSKRGKRNESALLLETAQVMAGLRQVSLEELGARTTANAKTVFGL